MGEFIINIAQQKESLIKELVIELGGEIAPKKTQTLKKAAITKPAKKNDGIAFLFGQWKNIDIDSRKLREEAWGRKF